MPRIPRPSPRQVLAGGVVLTVTLTSGLLFSFSALNARRSDVHDTDLIGLVEQRQAVVTGLENEAHALSDRVRTLMDTTLPTASGPRLTTLDTLTAQTVSGPGLVITLTDAPPGPLPEGASPDDLVIHQQDIEDVMNALWDGGAEAITVQGVRITSRTVVRCIGNVILVDGTSYSPPYTVAAIGDPTSMRRAVDANPRIINYKNYVSLYGLGWKAETKSRLEFPPATGATAPRWARPMEKNG